MTRKIGGKCPDCSAISPLVEVPKEGAIWSCAHCERVVIFEDESDEEDPVPPGLTVGDLRRALKDVPDNYCLTLRMTDEEENLHVSGVISAAMEDSCSGMHFAIDGSTNSEDFEDAL